jgi:hypothetical protein
MNPCDPILFRQLPVIQKIIQDETWLEGERRGCQVLPNDHVVRENVCRIVMRIGQQLRDSLTPPDADSQAGYPAPMAVESTPPVPPSQNEAA